MVRYRSHLRKLGLRRVRGTLFPRRLPAHHGCLRAGRADIIRIVLVFDQTFIQIVADLLAGHADEVDPLGIFVDALAVENAPGELPHADAQEFVVLAFDLEPPRFVLGHRFGGVLT